MSEVAVSKCIEYSVDSVYPVIDKQLQLIGFDEKDITDKKITIKPNLVIAKSPEHAATTNPIVLQCVIRYLKQYKPKEIVIAESFGGPYTELSLKNVYKATKILDVATEEGITLNYDTSSSSMYFEKGKQCKSFNVISPIHNADVIIDICKLKTHSLTKMSCAVKNFFGVIPGVEKFEMHARFAEHEAFFSMLVDLCQMICETKKVIAVCDGIIGMEGNGPTGGDPKEMHVILSSLSPFALDTVAEHLLKFDGTTPLVAEAINRKLSPSYNDIQILDTNAEELIVENIKLPETTSLKILNEMPNLFGGRLAKFFQPYPEIRKKTCIGCGTCERSCPAHTITIKNKLAIIDHDKCIRCYCCQELCPINSVYIKKNILLKIVQKL